MRDHVLSRRGFLRGSSAVAAGAVLMPRGLLSAGPRSAPGGAARAAAAQVTGATVNPNVYHLSDWARGAKVFDSYVGMPLAATIQKIYLKESEYFTDPLPSHIRNLAGIGCQFIMCFWPSRTTDESTELANCLQLLNSNGIIYRVALVNEWNCASKFTPQAYLDYWSRYAPVVQAAGVPVCNLVCASSTKSAFNKIEPGFPTSPLPDQYWIDYYAEAYRFNVRLDTPGGLLDQAQSLGVPAGIAEFGYAVAFPKTMTWAMWEKYVPYLAGLAPRMPLGCLYFGCQDENTVTSASDPKIPGIQQVVQGWTGS
jgi:hypothetical protein